MARGKKKTEEKLLEEKSEVVSDSSPSETPAIVEESQVTVSGIGIGKKTMPMSEYQKLQKEGKFK